MLTGFNEIQMMCKMNHESLQVMLKWHNLAVYAAVQKVPEVAESFKLPPLEGAHRISRINRFFFISMYIYAVFMLHRNSQLSHINSLHVTHRSS